MKAYSLYGINDFRYEEVAMPQCNDGWAIVKVMAAGICSSDIGRVYKSGMYHYPTIPGHEFAGTVHAVGSASDSSWIGKHVGVFPLIPCGHCDQCCSKHYEMCQDYDYVGSRRDGGFAEYVAVPIWNLMQLPAEMPFTVAAMLEPLSVGLHAVKKAGIAAGDRVAVVGTGMIGIGAAQWAKAYGAGEVTVVGRSEDKRGLVESCGVSYTSGASPDEQYDRVIEAVGTPQAIETAISTASPGATVVLMGNPSGDITVGKSVYWRILRKQITIVGTWNSSFDGVEHSDWTEVRDALVSKTIEAENLISHVYPQERLMEGMALMNEHSEPYCKVMTIWNSEKK